MRTPKDLNGFLFEIVDCNPFLDLSGWNEYMDTVPVDPYVKEGFRFKSIAWFRVKHNEASPNPEIDAKIQLCNQRSGLNLDSSCSSQPTWVTRKFSYWHLPNYGLQQSAAYNPVHGDICRHYPPVPKEFVAREDFRLYLEKYADYMSWDDDVVLVQFQRIIARKQSIGLPAVEGFHKDGNVHACMLIMQRRNVRGAVSQMSTDSQGKELIYDQVIPVGHCLYWHDKAIWHYATPLSVEDESNDDFIIDPTTGQKKHRSARDVLLMSAGGQQHMGTVKLHE